MQNHGGYNYEDYSNTIEVSQYSESPGDVSQYLSLLNETDKAVEQLIRYFEANDRDVVIVLFGDHMPGFTSEFYERVNGGPIDTPEEKSLIYKVPFFIWTNKEIDNKYIETTSLNYLSNFMYEVADLPFPPYGAFLEDIRVEIPSISAQIICWANGQVEYMEDQKAENGSALNRYSQLAYNSLFDSDRSAFFIGTKLNTDITNRNNDSIKGTDN